MAEKVAPIEQFSYKNVTCSIFSHENEGENGKFITYSVSLQRFYRGKDKKIHYTPYLNEIDCLIGAALLKRAWMHINELITNK